MSDPRSIVKDEWESISNKDYYSLLVQTGIISGSVVNNEHIIDINLLPFVDNLKRAIENFFKELPSGKICLCYDAVTIPLNGISFTGIINGYSTVIGYLVDTEKVVDNPVYNNTYLGYNPLYLN